LADNTANAKETANTKKVAYEGMFIFDANRLARDPQGLPGAVAEMIEAAGGELEVSRLWEERRLAYPIKGHRKGAYWITYFHLPPSQVSPLNKQCEIKEGILRQLFVKLPESLIEPIIAHAKGEATTDEPETDEPKTSESPAAENGAPKAKPATKEEAAAS